MLAFVADFALVFLYTVDKLDQVFAPPGNPRPTPAPESAESDIDYNAVFGDPD